MGGVGGHLESSIFKFFLYCSIGVSSAHGSNLPVAGPGLGVGSLVHLKPGNVNDGGAEVGAQQ